VNARKDYGPGPTGAPWRPVTPDDVERNPDRESGRYTACELLKEWNELDDRHGVAHAIATLKARGKYDPTRHSAEADYPPLTAGEHLRLLALGEAIARIVRHPVQVDEAVKAGATWQQIASATGQSEDAARQAYRDWADGQRRLYEDLGDRFGMTHEAHAAAIERAAQPNSLGPSADREAGQ
jgi:hypothetical protein